MNQASWFIRDRSENLPSDIERYRDGTKRVLGMLESVSSTQEWLVGGMLTIADMIYVP